MKSEGIFRTEDRPPGSGLVSKWHGSVCRTGDECVVLEKSLHLNQALELCETPKKSLWRFKSIRKVDVKTLK